jgi:regulator of sirC expression with transglutaminase-like and TPR domain
MDDDLEAFRDAVGSGERIDLARAAVLVACVEHPGLDPGPHLARLDRLAERSGVAGVAGEGARLERLRRFLFEDEGFRGNAEAYHDPRNSCLNDVLDRRLGIPITLSVLLVEVGRRLGVPVHGVGLPGHFVAGAHVDGCEVLVDAFHGGAVLTREEAPALVARAVGRDVPLVAAHFAPATARQILVRMLANLRAVYLGQEAWAKALAVMERVLVLEPDVAGHLRDRGFIRMKLGDFHRGAADWERYLGLEPDARDAGALRGQLRRLREALASRN